MPYLLVDKHNVVTGVSPVELSSEDHRTFFFDSQLKIETLLGKRVGKQNAKDLRLAVVCNWNSPCGISTYSKYLVDALRPLVNDLRIFSEIGEATEPDQEKDKVIRCWKRGESMRPAIKKVLDWKADFVLIQHEFGIFPHATYFLQMLNMLSDTPYAVTLHSIYEHIDKTIQTSAIENIIVHTIEAKEMLYKLGHLGDVHVIPHGCIVYDSVKELWNTFHTPYAIMQFGFGFQYKGVDRAIEAVAHLKNTDPKFKDIFYVYLCSQSANNNATHAKYYRFLMDKIESLGMEDNVAIIQKFNTEQTIVNYLRTAKLALFPYKMDIDNTVYAASGAIRIAMANKIPVIASESHLFDDLDGIVPRPDSSETLAHVIDQIFSNGEYRNKLLENSEKYVKANEWGSTANRYLEVIEKIMYKTNHIPA